VYVWARVRARARQRPERLGDPAQRTRRVEATGDDQGGVVGLIEAPIERLQARDVDVLDVAARADRALAVVVPVVHGRQRPLLQDAAGVVLAELHLVAHHGHLGVEVAPGDVAVEHRIGLPAQIPAQVVVVGGEAGVVVGAVVPGRAVGAQAAPVELEEGSGRLR
jgi:hypothetical protein